MAVNLTHTELAGVSNGFHVQEKLLKMTTRIEADQHCSVEILPILFQKASFPFQRSPARDSSAIVRIEESEANPNCDPHLAFLSFLEVTNPAKSKMSLETLDSGLTCQNKIDIHVNDGDAYSSCIVNIDIEKDKLKAPKSREDTCGRLRADNTFVHIEKVLQRQASLKMGGKLMQFLMDHGLMLLKFTCKEKSGAERVHDAATNRWKRYRRVASFDSRMIVILFSVLSILGTLTLIYLTLRVRQQSGGDGFVGMSQF